MDGSGAKLTEESETNPIHVQRTIIKMEAQCSRQTRVLAELNTAIPQKYLQYFFQGAELDAS